METRLVVCSIITKINIRKPGGTPGMFPDPLPWYSAGAGMGALVKYWYLTDDDYYNKAVTQGMLHQVGADWDYLPSNWTQYIGNDDHLFWGLTAMTAAECNYPNPPKNQPQWLALAQAVQYRLRSNWDTTACNGGLRWQVHSFAKGYNYKNTISNGGLFHLSARLARYTKDASYTEWCDRTYDWLEQVGFITPNYEVYDGAVVPCDRNNMDKNQWSYNIGNMLGGCCFLANFTQDQKWFTRIENYLGVVERNFMHDGVLYESLCESNGMCDGNSLGFKGYLADYLSSCAHLVPSTRDRIDLILRKTAQAIGESCTGGNLNAMCGMQWSLRKYDHSDEIMVVLPIQISALNALVGHLSLLSGMPGPMSADSGGTSVGDDDTSVRLSDATASKQRTITTADTVGAVILLIISSVSVMALGWWVMV